MIIASTMMGQADPVDFHRFVHLIESRQCRSNETLIEKSDRNRISIVEPGPTGQSRLPTIQIIPPSMTLKA
jgi:hypothetical protein